MISKEQVKNDLITNIANREQEIYGYQININNYEAILELIPNKWNARLLEYKMYTSEQIVNSVHSDDRQLVSDLVFIDKISVTIEIEKLEQSKSIHVLNALKSQLDKLGE